jgi:hypothetical protein
MIFIAIVAALCGVASLILGEITALVMFFSIAKACAVIVVIALLIAVLKFVFYLFS